MTTSEYPTRPQLGVLLPARPVTLVSQAGGFGEPRFNEQGIGIEGLYSLTALASDIRTFAATGGAAAVANRMFSCTTGTDVGGYGVVQSLRVCKVAPGQAATFRISAAFTTGVALSQQFAGAFSATSALLVGYLGADFGIMRRLPGAIAIHRLTVTVGSGAVEEITLTLNGVDFVFSTAGALSTTAFAEFIAEQTETVLTGWTGFAAQSVGATVTFFQNVPAVEAGAFTIASDGTAAGTWTVPQVGAPNVATEASGAFIPRTEWNIDRMSSALGLNPSGITLDVTKLNIWEISTGFMDCAAVTFSVMSPDGYMVPVHRIKYPGTSVSPIVDNPTLRVGWFAYSLGSTTALEVIGGTAAAFLDGAPTVLRSPRSASGTITASTTEYVVLAVRARGEFGDTFNQRIMNPQYVSGGAETASRLVRFRIYLDPVLAGTVNWTQVADTSSMDAATPTTVTPTGGTLIATYLSTAQPPDIGAMMIMLGAGRTMVITAQAVSQTTVVAVSIGWHEF